MDSEINYEKAIDNSIWSRTGNSKCLLPNENTFKDCLIELEWTSGQNDLVEYGTLTLFCLNKAESWGHINLRDVTGVIGCSLPRCPRFALYTSTPKPYTFQFSSKTKVSRTLTNF